MTIIRNEHGEYDVGSIGIRSQIDEQKGSKCHQHGTQFQQKYMQIIPRATHGQSPKGRSQKDFVLAANGRYMGPKRGSRIVVLGIRFCQFMGMFSHSILEVNYYSLLKDCHDVRIALGDHVAYTC